MTMALQGPARYERQRVAVWAAGGYAALVVGLAVWIEALILFDDPGFAGVWLIWATLPIAIPLSALPIPNAAFLPLLTVGGLAQAWVLWRVVRGKRLN
ncbi:SCO4225 family membrane protein [Streptomyces sp. NPDC058001]|uniref:SCO4225 family membrane protein n=1 Tax=Streptomyces sp. NPDC058001 TaxID=3346300 RepID=UPI0036DFC5B8